MSMDVSIGGLLMSTVILGGTAIAQGQSGPIQYVSQARSVNVKGYDFIGPDPVAVKETIAASDFGPFDKLLIVGEIPGKAQQASVLSDHQITATGYGTGQHYLQGWNSSGNSSFSVTFEVHRALEFVLSGFVKDGEGTGPAQVSLSGPGQNLAFALPPATVVLEFYETGTLVPGVYTLAAYGAGTGIGGWWGPTMGIFNLNFEVAGVCDADCDASGQLNIDDFICFQTLFALGDPAADCDASGGLNIDDFICFQTLFALGC